MIWFDIKELERGLKEGNMPDKEIFYYLIANLLLFSIVPYIYTNDFHNKWLISVEIGISIITTVIGTKLTYDINSKRDNLDYFRRFLSLSFVTGVRLLVFALIAAIPVGTIAYFIGKGLNVSETIKDIFVLLLTTVSAVLYYYLLTTSFKRVSG